MKKATLLYTVLIFLSFMNACSQKEKVDLILTNATVYTIDAKFSKTESFAVKNGKILDTGTTEEILAKYSSDNNIDAGGKFVYPGFNDAHCHFNGYGINLMQ